MQILAVSGFVHKTTMCQNMRSKRCLVKQITLLLLQLATHATFHEVHSRSVAASVVVHGVSQHVVHVHVIRALSGRPTT